MEELVNELKELVNFKETTHKGDIVLVVGKEPQLLAYALVTDIVRDQGKRDEWWFVTLQFLTVPPQEATWILRTEQMTGQEIFTMGGAERYIKAVDFDRPLPEEPDSEPPPRKEKATLRVVK